MGIAKVNIIDKIKNVNITLTYTFIRIKRYRNLYEDLKELLVQNGYSKNEASYKKCEVNFLYHYSNSKIYIDKWSKYLLNGEIIDVIIDYPLLIYTLYDSTNGKEIISSKKMGELYYYYTMYLKNRINYPILLRDNYHLIDVLENPENYVNSCKTRLVHFHNF